MRLRSKGVRSVNRRARGDRVHGLYEYQLDTKGKENGF